MARKALLVCGILSSLLYVATDVLGGMRYEGYSFTSQAISELMATGAPSEAFVDPLFITYGVLILAFGVGVLREGVRRSRALRITGALLMGYAVRGATVGSHDSDDSRARPGRSRIRRGARRVRAQLHGTGRDRRRRRRVLA